MTVENTIHDGGFFHTGGIFHKPPDLLAIGGQKSGEVRKIANEKPAAGGRTKLRKNRNDTLKVIVQAEHNDEKRFKISSELPAEGIMSVHPDPDMIDCARA